MMGVLVQLLPLCMLLQQVDHITAPPGFVVEQVTEAAAEHGSWVCMDFDSSGRLVIAPERGRLLRLTFSGNEVETERFDAPVERAQGLLHHGNSLYCNVNAPLDEGGGLHRLRDLDQDGSFETHEQLARWDWGGEHGAHAIVLSPSGDSLYLVHGNHVRPPEDILETSPLRNWDEDILLERLWDPRGHAVGRMAPAGYVMEVDLDGTSFRLVAGGLRNAYDIAFNEDGELFTYDADMEWDIGTGWYRFPRIVHVVSGGETGWRGGSAKWSDAWPDVNPPVAETDVGSPTGIRFAHDTSFPEPWRSALLVGDWSWGRVLAVHLQQDGAGWKGTIEPFIKGRPFNITDLDVGPDGHLYCITGGRGTSSALYRVRWTGDRSTELDAVVPGVDRTRLIRLMLESWHGDADPGRLDDLYVALGHDDRSIRFAARVALERLDPDSWSTSALQESGHRRAIELLVALARVGSDLQRARVIERVEELLGDSVTPKQEIGLLRAAMIALSRSESVQQESLESLGEIIVQDYPTGMLDLDRLRETLLVAMDHPDVVPLTLDAIDNTSSHAAQLQYALPLRLATHWSELDRARFLEWTQGARRFEGGLSIQGFVEGIARPILGDDLPPLPTDKATDDEPLPSLHAWTMEEVRPHLPRLDEPSRSIERGRVAYEDAQCSRCHRFGSGGGDLGPDLTAAAARFSRRDLLEAILSPSANITDQYATTRIQLVDGTALTGRILGRDEQHIQLLIDPYGMEKVAIPVVDIISEAPGETSFMPIGLVNGLTLEQILDLLYYIEQEQAP